MSKSICKGIISILLVIVLFAYGLFATAEYSVLQIPVGTTIIDDEAFFGDYSLRTIIIPEGVVYIGVRAFCFSGIEKIFLPASLEYIADNAFLDCRGFVVHAPAGSYAYNWCKEHSFSVVSTDPSPTSTVTPTLAPKPSSEPTPTATPISTPTPEPTSAPSLQPGTFQVTVSATCNNFKSVGYNWMHDFYINSQPVSSTSASKEGTVTASPKTISIKAGDKLTLRADIAENDKIPDEGSSSITYTVTSSDIASGFRLSFNVRVEENAGRYKGNIAEWTITFSFEILTL